MINFLPYFAGFIMLLFSAGFYFALHEHRNKDK